MASMTRVCVSPLPVAEGPLLVASPKVGQDDHAGNRRVCTPNGCKRISLDSHHDEQDGKVRRAENNHHLELGKEEAKKFSDMLAWITAYLERPHELCQELRALGARHSEYGVKIDQYAPVGSALTWMFQHTLGERFTPEMEEAWLEFYAFASFEMERGSREAAATSTHP